MIESAHISPRKSFSALQLMMSPTGSLESYSPDLRQAKERLLTVALIGALGVPLAVLFDLFLRDQVRHDSTLFIPLGLSAFVVAMVVLLRRSDYGAWSLSWVDRLLFGAVSLSIGLVAALMGGLTSPMFLYLALIILARNSFVQVPLGQSLFTLLLVCFLYPLTLALGALFSDQLAASWTQFDDLVRFLFGNVTVFGAAVLGLLVRASRRRVPSTAKPVYADTDDYQIIKHLETDETGDVFLVKQPILGREVALKLLAESAQADPQLLRRFEREVLIPARLRHPNIIEIHACERMKDGRLGCVMEHLDGLTVGQLVESAGPLSAGRVVYLLKQVAEALELVHMHGLVHSNLNPEAIVVTRRGSDADCVKLRDFGSAAKVRKSAEQVGGELVPLVGDFCGDAQYTAPEVVKGQAPDHRSDIYSLGAIAYYMLSARRLFDYEQTSAILQAQVSEDPKNLVSIVRSIIPPDLEQVVIRALSKLPEYRFRTIGQFSRALQSSGAAMLWSASEAQTWWSGFKTGGIVRRSEIRTDDPSNTLPTRPDHHKRPLLQ